MSSLSVPHRAHVFQQWRKEQHLIPPRSSNLSSFTVNSIDMIECLKKTPISFSPISLACLNSSMKESNVRWADDFFLNRHWLLCWKLKHLKANCKVIGHILQRHDKAHSPETCFSLFNNVEWLSHFYRKSKCSVAGRFPQCLPWSHHSRLINPTPVAVKLLYRPG